MAGAFGHGGPGRFAANDKYKGSLKDSKILSKLIKLAKPFWKGFLLAFFIISIIAVVEIVRPNVIRIMIDDYIQEAVKGNMEGSVAKRNIMLLGLVFLGIMTVQFILEYIQTVVLQTTGKKIILKLRGTLFRHVEMMKMPFFDKIPAGVLVTRITNDTEAINQMYTEIIVHFIKEVLIMIGILIVMFTFHVKLTLIVMVVLPFVFVAISIFRKRARIIFDAIRKKLAEVNAFLSEHIMGIKIIKAFNMTDIKKEEYDNISKEYNKEQNRIVNLFGIFRPFMEFLNTLALTLIIWFGSKYLFDEVVAIGLLYMFVRYTNMLFQPIIRLSEMFNVLQSSLVAAERVFGILDTKQEENMEENEGKKSEIKGNIEFEHVYFAYEEENWVLKDVSFKVNANEQVAFVGHTGAGKTTIINLICGFYFAQKGRVLIDGVDIREINKRHLRRHIGLVLQDVQLFYGDVLTNIRLYDKSITRQEVVEASKNAYSHRFIERLKDGYDSHVYYGGSTFSNGERQLLSFARAIVKKPNILVLDEATSNVDTETERLIQKSLENISKGRTTVAIAHRLSTIKHSNRIIVIHKGVLREEGSHEELMKKQGIYYTLYTLQYAKI